MGKGVSKSGSTAKKRERREFLHSQHPYCYWCKIRVYQPMRKDVYTFDNTATLDHINSSIKLQDTVLACAKCNQWRGRLEEKRLTELGLAGRRFKYAES